MATTRDDLSAWFDYGLQNSKDYMIVVCDTFDWEDYPVYCTKEELNHKIKSSNNVNMQKIMEIYDLKNDKESQMIATRTGLDLIDKAYN